jgi:hypothetical protein
MNTDANQNLWRFIRLDQYSRPAETSRETVRKRFFGLWRHLGLGGKAEESVFAEKEVRQAPRELIDKAAPEPDWSGPLAAMTAVLDTWLDAKVPGSLTQIFVGPPYHGTPEILTAWAQARDWRLVAAPPPETILSGGEDWLAQLAADDEPMVLPHLEHCYLRHHDGLTLLRRLLDQIFSRSRRWLVGCDSWAWAYLSKALKINTVLPTPFILEAFDQERLKIWFQQLAAAAEEGAFVFRQSSNGRYIFRPAAGDETAGNGGLESVAEDGGFLKNLAAYSLGIPGIALAVWRRSLGFVNATAEAGNKCDQETPGSEDGTSTCPIWVQPWTKLSLPGFPGQRPSVEALMILHTLLLHGGLWSRIIPELLPLSPLEILEDLYLLEASGLVESDQGFWRVAPTGYPTVRQTLQSEGYLTDAT